MPARGAPSPFRTPPAGQNYPEEDDLARRKAAVDADGHATRQAYELTSEELIQSETLSEARQDVEEGFRPNISSYVELDSSPSRSSRSGSLAARQKAEHEARRRENEQRRAHEETVVGFPDLAIFSGADERFSYARAVSRLHEMSNPTWRARKQWTPLLENELRLWGVDGGDAVEESSSTTSTRKTTSTHEGTTTTTKLTTTTTTTAPRAREEHPTLAGMGDFADEASYEASTFPSRTSFYQDGQRGVGVDTEKSGPVAYNMPSTARTSPRYEGERSPEAHKPSSTSHAYEGPPKISPVHIWGQADWGPKAGKWGRGPSALRGNEDEELHGADAQATGEELRERRARLRREREQAKAKSS